MSCGRGGLRTTLELSPGELGEVPGLAAWLQVSHARGGGTAPRMCPRAFILLPAPPPTVELEVADALALSVSGRGAAEAASQRLTLAAQRPPAAGEGHCQQPQPPHHHLPLGTHTAVPNRQRLPVPRRQLERGRTEWDPCHRPAPRLLTANKAGSSTTSQRYLPIKD